MIVSFLAEILLKLYLSAGLSQLLSTHLIHHFLVWNMPVCRIQGPPLIPSTPLNYHQTQFNTQQDCIDLF